MCKKLFVFIGLFVLLFGFNMNVKAAKAVGAPKYEFTISSSLDKEFFNMVCVDMQTSLNVKYHNDAMVGIATIPYCIIHDKSSNTWINHDLTPIENLKNVDKFGFEMINNINENSVTSSKFGLKQHLLAMSCPIDGGSCYDYVALNICGDGKERFNKINNNKKVCQGLKDFDEVGTSVELSIKDKNGNPYKVHYCTSRFKTVGESKSSSFQLEFSYDESDGEFKAREATNSGTWLEKGNDFIKSTSQSDKFNTFYLHSKNGTLNDFKDRVVELLKKDICNDSIGVLCLDGNAKPSEFVWYIEESEDMCVSGNGYVEGVSQKMGDDSSANFALEYTDLKTKLLNYASKIIGERNKDNLAEILSCEELLGGDGDESTIISVLKVVVNIIKFIVPVIFVVMGSLDFIQAIFAQDDGGMKKAQGKFIKRLIIAVVIFLIPYALKLVLTVANGIWPFISPDFCGVL